MKTKLLSITALFTAIILCVTICFVFTQKNVNIEDIKAEQILALNEIEQLTKNAVSANDTAEIAMLEDKIAILQDEIRNSANSELKDDLNSEIFIMCGICIAFLVVIFGYVYLAVLCPFDKMKGYAEKIAQGNFDTPLNYERSNYFGEFTWAFDHMRLEIINARSCEREAIENNKTVIATLSHDIKTPISSICAYAEGLEANLDTSAEKRAKYLGVIMKKCDEVAKLTNDLFLHSLSDLDKLKITPENVSLREFLSEIVTEISAEQNDICFTKPNFDAVVFIDKNRFVQVTENLINNARKYAKTKIDIWAEQKDNSIFIHFRDYGEGIPDKDMPFIFEKFYRGRNSKDEQGSGLGLFIVKYIMEHMKGMILLHNHSDGLEATLILPIQEIIA